MKQESIKNLKIYIKDKQENAKRGKKKIKNNITINKDARKYKEM